MPAYSLQCSAVVMSLNTCVTTKTYTKTPPPAALGYPYDSMIAHFQGNRSGASEAHVQGSYRRPLPHSIAR